MSATGCAACGHPLKTGRAFELGAQLRCPGCALTYRPMLKRSLATSLVVGALLLVINQSTVLLDGRSSPSLYWQIPLTYLVPFCVATWGALINNRR